MEIPIGNRNEQRTRSCRAKSSKVMKCYVYVSHKQFSCEMLIVDPRKGVLLRGSRVFKTTMWDQTVTRKRLQTVYHDFWMLNHLSTGVSARVCGFDMSAATTSGWDLHYCTKVQLAGRRLLQRGPSCFLTADSAHRSCSRSLREPQSFHKAVLVLSRCACIVTHFSALAVMLPPTLAKLNAQLFANQESSIIVQETEQHYSPTSPRKD